MGYLPARRVVTLAAVLLLAANACGGEKKAALSPGPRVTTSTLPAPTTTLTTTSTASAAEPPAEPSFPVPPAGPPAGPGAVIAAGGVVVPVVTPQAQGWTVTTPCGRTAHLTAGTFVPGATVVLDPGHGGSDAGARSPDGLKEATVNLAVTGYTSSALQAAGVSVLVTRAGDYDVDLGTRTALAKAAGAFAFVSIHHNAEPDGPWPRPGSETYYQIGSPPSKRLAGLIYEEVLRALTPYAAAWVADADAGAKYRPGMHGDYYFVLRQSAPIVSALVESAFITNPPEAALIARPDVQQVEGLAIARGILRYLHTQDPGSGFTEPYPRVDPPTPPTTPPPPCVDPPL